MLKNVKWFGLTAYLLLAVACFIPWTWHADIQKIFTGFFSENNIYGKPGKFLLITGALATLSLFLTPVWFKRAGLFLGAIQVAYAIKNFLLFGSCYRGYCPEKKFGLWLMLFSSLLILAAVLFPTDRKLTTEKNDSP
jgi:hypothetical protein